MKKNNKKGFTLAELLIVVAIIAVLVAIAIPIFTSQLEKSRESTDLSNIRSYYAEITTALLTGDLTKSGNKVYVANNLEATLGADLPTTAGSTFTVTVANATLKQQVVKWQTASYDVAGVTSITGIDSALPTAGNASIAYTFTLATDGDYNLTAIAIS
jgi:prepilin-type N-terminal cleavage/methylation domain-containing protein